MAWNNKLRNRGSCIWKGQNWFAVFSMKDMLVHFEKLKADAAECALIRDLATDNSKRELFTRLAEHFDVLASEIEGVISGTTNGVAG